MNRLLRGGAQLVLASLVCSLVGCAGNDTPVDRLSVDSRAQVFVVSADGDEVRRLTDDDVSRWSLTWSPDGSQLATVSDTAAIEVLDVDGSGRRELVGGSRLAGDVGLAWSPDGARLALLRRLDDGIGVRIETVGTNGGGHALVDSFDSARMVSAGPTWSPDATRLAYARDDLHIVVVRLHDRSRRAFRGEGLAEFDPRWSPAGEAVLFMRETSGGYFDLAVGIADRGRPRVIARRLIDAHAEWSPKGRWIAFAGVTFAGDRMYYLYVVDSSGRVPPRKLAGPVETVRPSWSPDGREIAFVTAGGIETIAPTGGAQRAVINVDPEQVQISELSWSPDGASIAFVASERQKQD